MSVIGLSFPTIPEWYEQASCAQIPVSATWDPFFAGEEGNTATHAEAKAICDQCPTRIECRKWGKANGERHGVWGGAPARSADPEPRAAECGTLAGYKRHISAKEPTCDQCKAANAEYQREKRLARGATPRRRQPLDTQPAADAHPHREPAAHAPADR